MWPIFLIHWDFHCVSSCNKIIFSLLLFLALLKESNSSVEPVIKSRHLSLVPASHHLPFSEATTSSPFSRCFWHLPPCATWHINIAAFHSGGQRFFLLISPETYNHTDILRILTPYRYTPFSFSPDIFVYLQGNLGLVSIQSSCFHYSINTINSQGATWMGLWIVGGTVFWADWTVSLGTTVVSFSLSFRTGQIH